MIIIPTRGRPDNIRRFVVAYKKTLATEPFTLLLDNNDEKKEDYYPHLEGLDAWCVLDDTNNGIAGRMNDFFEKNPDKEYYAIIGDDVVPETTEWDQRMKEACLPDKICWAHDGIQNGGLPTHPFIGGDLVRSLGWIAHPKLKHMYVDNVWRDITVQEKNGVYLDDVRLIHHHYVNNKAEMDDVYSKSLDYMNDDQMNYLELRREKFYASRRNNT